MIHSESGGILSFDETKDIAKVQILEGDTKGAILWFVVPENLVLAVGDVVVVAVSGKHQKAKILRIDQSVSPKNMPFSAKHAKEIISKAKQTSC